MKYVLYRGSILYRKATIKTCDGKVTEASKSFQWSVGKDIGYVLDWALHKGFYWRVMEDKV